VRPDRYCRRIAFALELYFGIVDRTGRVSQQHQFEIDRLLPNDATAAQQSASAH